MKYYRAKCSQCGLGFRSSTRKELLNKLRKHLFKVHRTWMVARIKAGQKKAHNNPGVLEMIRDVVTGDIIPGYKAYKRKHYEAIKPLMDKLSPFLPPAVRGAWQFVDKMADKLYPKVK